ncbi:MAG: peptidoglycan DD-metalloendopeptidase family protein [Oscillibacter sp.]|nr:peptidoglycan DD-metalloendopeptidase family protein [Oscillibacter sp.]
MRKKTYRFAALFCLCLMLLSSAVSAASKLPTLSASKYIQTYTLNASGKVYAYTDSTLKKQKATSWIDCQKDECYIIAISGNAVKVSYPVSKGRNVEWFKRSDFSATNLAGSLKYETFFKRVNTYRHSNGKVPYGYAENRDKVYVLSAKGAYTQIVYPLTNGKWKMAWAKTADVNAALKIPVSVCSITGPANAPYTGKPVTPAVTVKYGSKTLKNGTDYTLTWANNVKAGTAAKVTITGKGNYTGSVAKTFSIIGETTTKKYVQTAGANLNVREKASTSAKILGQLSNGTEVAVYSTSNGWAKIRYNTGIGYVSGEYLVEQPGVVNNFLWPCASNSAYQITCLYYYKDGSKHSTRYGYAYGMDITGGGNIRAVERGTVETAENLGSKSFGRYIVIRHPNGTRSLYAHLKSFASGIKKGATVSRGQTLGVMGTTGNSSGIHLHFELSNANPWRMYYRDIQKITFQQNVYSNNKAKKNVDSNSAYIVNWIEKYYKKSGDQYVRK